MPSSDYQHADPAAALLAQGARGHQSRVHGCAARFQRLGSNADRQRSRGAHTVGSTREAGSEPRCGKGPRHAASLEVIATIANKGARRGQGEGNSSEAGDELDSATPGVAMRSAAAVIGHDSKACTCATVRLPPARAISPSAPSADTGTMDPRAARWMAGRLHAFSLLACSKPSVIVSSRQNKSGTNRTARHNAARRCAGRRSIIGRNGGSLGPQWRKQV